jgi:hypothetical protein
MISDCKAVLTAQLAARNRVILLDNRREQYSSTREWRQRRRRFAICRGQKADPDRKNFLSL